MHLAFVCAHLQFSKVDFDFLNLDKTLILIDFIHR